MDALGSWKALRELLLDQPKEGHRAARLESAEITNEWFAEHFELGNVPALISGVSRSWIADSGRWSIESFLARFGVENMRFRDDVFQTLQLDKYYEYMKASSDDSPFGVYDSLFGHVFPTNELIEEYSPPHISSPRTSLSSTHKLDLLSGGFL